MGRYRSKSRSYSPPPPRRSRSPPRRKRYDDSRDRYRSSKSSSYRDRRSSGPTGLLVRNISLDARSEDLRIPFERFGPVKDVYLPKNYYTGEPRGFGFVKFHNADDAADAKERMNHQVIGGREIRIVFAEENRKTPQEMRTTTSGVRYGGGGYRRRSPPRSSRHRHRSYSRSASPARRYSRSPSRTRRYSRSPPSRRYSRSPSPSPSPSPSRRYSRSSSPPRGISRSPSPPRGISRSPSPPRVVSHSPSPPRGISCSPSPPRRDSRSHSLLRRVPSPVRRVSRSPSLTRHDSRSLSPVRRYSRERDCGARTDYHHPSQRFISKSPSPNGEIEYMSDRRSLSLREGGRRPSRSHSYRYFPITSVKLLKEEKFQVPRNCPRK